MAEGNKEKLHIRLHVYDMDISVAVPVEEETLYREAAILITNTLNSYASVFMGHRSEKEIMYMALIEIALRFEKEAKRNDTKPYRDILVKLTSEIEGVVKG